MEKGIALLDKLIETYGDTREALVEILRDWSAAQGHLDREDLAQVARRLHLPESQVYGVASFYSLINITPRGQHVVRFCQDAPCHVVGGAEVWVALEAELGIPFGATSADGEWTLLPTSCIGTCAVGPVMMVDEEIYGNLTPEKVRQIIAGYRAQGGAA